MVVVERLSVIVTAAPWSMVYALAYRLGNVDIGLPFFGSAGLMAVVKGLV